MEDSYPLNVNKEVAWRVEIKNKLCFERHISTQDKKASSQSYAVRKMQKFMGFKHSIALLLF